MKLNKSLLRVLKKLAEAGIDDYEIEEFYSIEFKEKDRELGNRIVHEENIRASDRPTLMH